jgi:hypothetical protein
MPIINYTAAGIEERLGKAETATSNIGNLAALATTAKNNLVAAVNELFTSVSNGKSLIASAITGKGVPTLADASFATMAANINSISAGQVVTDLGEINAYVRNAGTLYFELSAFPRYNSISLSNIIYQFTAISRNATANTVTFFAEYNAANGRLTVEASALMFAAGTTAARIYIVE